MKLLIILAVVIGGSLSVANSTPKNGHFKPLSEKQRKVASVGEIPECAKTYKDNEYYGHYAYLYLQSSDAQGIKSDASASDIVAYLHLLDENRLNGQFIKPVTMEDLGSTSKYHKGFIAITSLIGKVPVEKADKAKFNENLKKLAQLKNVVIYCAAESIE